MEAPSFECEQEKQAQGLLRANQESEERGSKKIQRLQQSSSKITVGRKKKDLWEDSTG